MMMMMMISPDLGLIQSFPLYFATRRHHAVKRCSLTLDSTIGRVRAGAVVVAADGEMGGWVGWLSGTQTNTRTVIKRRRQLRNWGLVEMGGGRPINTQPPRHTPPQPRGHRCHRRRTVDGQNS